jgi:hypothetical protein
MRKLFAIVYLFVLGVLVGIISGLSPFATVGALFLLSFIASKVSWKPKGILGAFADVVWAQGNENMAGLVGNIYYCPIEDIDTFPDLSAAGSLDTAAMSNFVCKATKKFYQIYHTLDTGKLDDATVGERDGKSKENLLEFFFPGGKKEVAEFERQALNTPCVVICKDTEGNLRLLGAVNLDIAAVTITGDIPAYLESSSGTTGAARADRRGKTFQFKHSAPHAPLFYKGSIPLVPPA